MEIKRSPEVARPVEVAKKAPKWPLVVGLSVGGVVVLGLGVLGYVMYSQRMQPQVPEPVASNQAAEPAAPTQGTTVNPTPNPEDLSKLVFGTYDDPVNEDQPESGPLTVQGLDLSASSPRARELTTLVRDRASTALRGAASPNGQFLAIFEPEGDGDTTGEEGPSRLTLTNLVDGTTQEVAQDLPLVGQLVWSDDSKLLIWGETLVTSTGEGLSADVALVSYNLASGESARSVRASEAQTGQGMHAVALRDDELFVVRYQTESDDPGTLGIVEAGPDGSFDGTFEKLFGVPTGLRGMDVSSDGRQVVVARDSGELGDEDRAPYVIELFNRADGDLTELRTSPTEEYASPLFTPDDEQIVYTAASGIWAYTLNDSGDRVQLISSDEIDSVVRSGELQLLSIQPDGGNLVFSAHRDNLRGVFALAMDAEEASVDDLVEVGEVLAQSVFGWTE